MKKISLAVIMAGVVLSWGYVYIISGHSASAGNIEESFSHKVLNEDSVLIKEEDRPEKSDHNQWWLKSGGALIKTDDEKGFGQTLQGSLEEDDKLRMIYGTIDPVASDNGFHPQNNFQILTKDSWSDFEQEIRFSIENNNVFNPENSKPTNGIWLLGHYSDQDNHYSAGLTVDGRAVIKKVDDGEEIILDRRSVFFGSYHHVLNPNLIPQKVELGMKLEISAEQENVLSLNLYFENGSGEWRMIAEAIDQEVNLSQEDVSRAGIKTEFMDVVFANHHIAQISEAGQEETNLEGEIKGVSTEEDEVRPHERARTSGLWFSSSRSRGSESTDKNETNSSESEEEKNDTENGSYSNEEVKDEDSDENTSESETGNGNQQEEESGGSADETSSNSGSNPLSGVKFFVNPNSNAGRQADEWRNSRPEDAALMDILAVQPESRWFGDWNPNIEEDVRNSVQEMNAQGSTPIFVAYNIPLRDCGSYSAGGANNPEGYRNWIDSFARGLGNDRAVVVVEPDGLPGMDCLSDEDRETRMELIRYAVNTFKDRSNTVVYIDAGHSNWHSAGEMAGRLSKAGIDRADGFALNTSNYHTTDSNISYGEQVSSILGGERFIIDTSRNGLGAPSNNEWCNPSGRALGESPTTNTGHSLVDAFLWVKMPGESDGTCNGGPNAGHWWADYALGLIERSHFAN